MSNAPEIMLVEDDESLGFLIRESLKAVGWNVHLYRSGETGLSAVHNHSFDICILDVMLPEKDGFTLAEEIRKYDQNLPIVFLTARNQAGDRIKGFQVGADDYVCKPFSMEEFRYRVEAILKRTGFSSGKNMALLHAGHSKLDVHNLVLDAAGEITRLTHKEARLLALFFKHSNKLVAREVFLKSVWEDDGFFVARSMDVFVSRLRKYLRKDAALSIENIRGVGYILKDLTAPVS
jgi:two-component system, OmpR family, response regulator